MSLVDEPELSNKKAGANRAWPITDSLQALICFFIVFGYEIHYVMLSSLVVITYIFFSSIRGPAFVRVNNFGITMGFLGLFVVYAIFNHLAYALLKQDIYIRNLAQAIFNCSYILLALPLKFNNRTFERSLIFFSILASLLVCLLFFVSDVSLKEFPDSALMVDHFPGWPTSVPLALILSIYLIQLNKRSIGWCVIIFSALFLTGSRGALAGGLIVFLLPFILRHKKTAVMGVACLLTVALGTLQDSAFFRAWDRIDIFFTSISYIDKSPLFGYGGNTIDQLQNVAIDFEPAKNWGHTHNLVLEIAIRYGLIGLGLFLAFITLVIFGIQDRWRRAVFLVFIGLAMFQTFFRDFNFLLILGYLIYSDKVVLTHHGNNNERN